MKYVGGKKLLVFITIKKERNLFRYALYILQLAILPWELCSPLAECIPCALTEWSGHSSPFSQDGLKHNEVILSCKQLIPNSKCLCLGRGK